MRGNSDIYKDILDVNISDTSQTIRKLAYDAIYSFASSEAAPELIKAADILTKVAGVNIKNARRRIAGKLIEDNVYRF